MQAQGQLAHGAPLLLGDGGGADLLGTVLLILAEIVEIGPPGDDLHGGEIGVAQNGHLDLPALDLLLHDDVVSVGQHPLQGLGQLLPGVRQLHADGAAAVDDLHGAGHRQLPGQTGNVLPGIAHVVPGGGGYTGGVHDALGDGFVHGHAAAQIAAAGIGHAQQVQGGLDASVLAAGAVESQEHQVCHGAHRQHVLAQHGRALIPATAAHGLQVRLGGVDPVVAAQAVRRVEDIRQAAVVILQPQEHIHQDGLVAPLPQGAAHAGAAGQRYLPLGAEAAGQHYDFHIQSLISHGGTRPRNAIISI